MNLSLEQMQHQKACYLLELLIESKAAHSLFMNEGKTFAHALDIMRINSSCLSILREIHPKLPSELGAHTTALINHLVDWIEQWENLRMQIKPKHDDVFVFKTRIPFPAGHEKKLIQFIKKTSQ